MLFPCFLFLLKWSIGDAPQFQQGAAKLVVSTAIKEDATLNSLLSAGPEIHLDNSDLKITSRAMDTIGWR
ncbi:hypothetical protein [Desertivirga xinjiangensis]|uniref:hypothetical protein n=1 Tax=Desertivirga xinjiangensis TaxID=539206 RepID=UPI00210CE091|nr:hypothetical protein [Pedobacter xinjiangensis]